MAWTKNVARADAINESEMAFLALEALDSIEGGTTNAVKEIADRWASMDAFIFAKRYPDSWIDHARRDIPNLIAWLGTEQEMHAAWRKRAEEAEAELDPAVCRLQFPDGTVPGNAREATEGWKKWYDEERAIVSRVWKALGINSYADAHGMSVDELVADVKRRAELWERLHDKRTEAMK